nr:hypothetical protein [Candidatus Contendobacter sp.]
MTAQSNTVRAALPISSESREWVNYRDVTWARMDTPEQPMVVNLVLLLTAPVDRQLMIRLLRF